MKKTIAAVAALLMVLAPTANASAAAKLHVISKHTAVGNYALTMASGTSNHPENLHLIVTSTPHQSALVSWDLVCTENSGGVGNTSGQRSLVTPVNRVLRPPAPSSSCIVSASAQLSKGGSITVALED